MKRWLHKISSRLVLILFACSVAFSCATKKDLIKINRELSSEIAQLRTEITDMLKDSDGDGVPDYLDREPNTPSGAQVDNLGRMLDSDGDGIPDHLDRCPFLPGPASNNGCPVEESRMEIIPRDPNRTDQFWPIPAPTYVEDITNQFIGNDDSLESLYSKLRQFLQKKGKQFNRVMYVPEDGFVVFSNLERINNNGSRSNKPIEIEGGGCGILNIIHCLYGKPSGRYMFFGLVVNNGKGLNSNSDIRDYNELMKIIRRGFINLDNSYVRDVNNNPISAKYYSVSLIVYEYETFPGVVPKLVTNTNINYFNLLFR